MSIIKAGLLLVPYIILVPINGAKLFILDRLLDRLIEGNAYLSLRLQRILALDIEWYRWLLRDIKDWFVLGVLGGVTLFWLPQLVPWLLTLLSFILFVFTLAPLVLLLYGSGRSLPKYLVSGAIWISLPIIRERIAGWGLILVLTGGAGLWAWAERGAPACLVWAFATLTLGFFSLLIAFFPGESAEIKPYR